MNDKEMEALKSVIAYVRVRMPEEFGPFPADERIYLDTVVLQDWLNYQIDMAAETCISNDAKRAAAYTYAKERG